MNAAQQEPKAFTVTRTDYSYAHKKVFGTFTGHVTERDVAAEFYHPYFGGRDAQVNAQSKTFSVVVHTD